MSNFYILSFNEFFSEFFVQVNKHFFFSREITMSNFFILSFNEFFSEFIVQDIEEDMYDGQVLQKLIEKLTSETLNVPEVTQSEDGQRNKLR